MQPQSEPQTNGQQPTKTYASPRLQLDDLQPINLKGSLSARHALNNLPEVQSMHNSPVTTRAKPVNPLCGEEIHYKTKYYQALDQGDGFRKKPGYFTEFAHNNRISTDLYKVDRSPASNHSRYVSKPVFFTTLESKNKLSEFITVDHSELLEITKRTSLNSSKIMNTSDDYRNDTINFSSNRKGNKSTVLPSLGVKKIVSERNKSQFLPRLDHSSPKKSQREITWSTKRGDESYAGSGNIMTSFNSFRSKAKPSIDFGKTSKSPEKKAQVTLSKLKNLNDLHASMKYNTKELTEALTTQYTMRTEDDIHQYVEHKGNLDYLRGSKIAVAQMDEERKFLKIHPGSPKAYLAQAKKESYKELATNQEIDNFEENLQGWMKSVPNFGRQRWTYEKDWEFKIV